MQRLEQARSDARRFGGSPDAVQQLPAPDVLALVANFDPDTTEELPPRQPDRTEEIRDADVLEELVLVLPTDAPRVGPRGRVWLGGSPKKRARAIVIGVMGASLAILAIAAVRGNGERGNGERAHAARGVSADDAPARAVAAAASNARSEGELAAPIPAALAPESAGTVLARGARALEIDGARVAGLSAVVPCGEHVVRLAGGKPRKVDVPCGGTAIVEPAGTLTLP